MATVPLLEPSSCHTLESGIDCTDQLADNKSTMPAVVCSSGTVQLGFSYKLTLQAVEFDPEILSKDSFEGTILGTEGLVVLKRPLSYIDTNSGSRCPCGNAKFQRAMASCPMDTAVP
jgi:hypothetical protein